jgi:hypothetical protein
MAARIVSAVLGAWLMFAPALLHYGGAAATGARLVGPLVVALSITACWEVVRALRFGVLPLGVWCVMAPWVLGYAALGPIVSDVTVGVALVGLTFVKGRIRQSYGGGWRALAKDR